jgi:hypothetical protein
VGRRGDGFGEDPLTCSSSLRRKKGEAWYRSGGSVKKESEVVVKGRRAHSGESEVFNG